MLKFLPKFHGNAATIHKLKEKEVANLENFERLKKVQKVLGQANKKDSSLYTPIPTKLSSLEKIAPQGSLYEIIKDMEIKMYCEDVIFSLISNIEEADPEAVLKREVEATSKKVELQRKRTLNSKHEGRKRLRLFESSYATWRERAFVITWPNIWNHVERRHYTRLSWMHKQAQTFHTKLTHIFAITSILVVS